MIVSKIGESTVDRLLLHSIPDAGKDRGSVDSSLPPAGRFSSFLPPARSVSDGMPPTGSGIIIMPPGRSIGSLSGRSSPALCATPRGSAATSGC